MSSRARSAFGDVADDGEESVAQFVAEFVERLGVTGDTDHSCAVGVQLGGDCPTETPARAGDQCGAVG